MKKTTAQKAATYRLPETTTPEKLEMKLMNNLGTILTFGNHILAAGYFYDPTGAATTAPSTSSPPGIHTLRRRHQAGQHFGRNLHRQRPRHCLGDEPGKLKQPQHNTIGMEPEGSVPRYSRTGLFFLCSF